MDGDVFQEPGSGRKWRFFDRAMFQDGCHGCLNAQHGRGEAPALTLLPALSLRLFRRQFVSKMSAAPVRRVAFGSCQERRLFPLHLAPDRLGNEMSREEAPHLGPGCYDSHEFGTMLYDVRMTPGSKRGYSARTAPRFPPCKMGTPSPQQYQRDQSLSHVPPPSKTPFNSTTPRFKHKPCTTDDTPGPGSYAPNAAANRKVSWPMCFGRPVWYGMPQLQRAAIRVKLDSEKELQKHRNRIAYLSLYY